jgi:hypothetical protein
VRRTRDNNHAAEHRKSSRLRTSELAVDGVTYTEDSIGVDHECDMRLTREDFSALARERNA